MERAVGRELDGYTETHHIIPRCMGGTNEPTNLVKLTYREHFITHWILYRLHPNNKRLAYAFSAMKMDKYGHKKTGWTPSSRQLEELKIAYIKARVGSKHSDETKVKMSDSLIKTFSVRGGSNLGRQFSDDTKQKMRTNKLGRTLSEEDRNAISEGKKEWYKNNPNPRLGKTTKIQKKWDRSKDGLAARMELTKELYYNGTPITEIEKVANISRVTIYKWIKEYNWFR